MPKITFLSHALLCPKEMTVEAEKGQTLLDVALLNEIPLEHACEKSCACTTCHVIIREGFDAVDVASEREEDLLDRAWGVTPSSRLSCQVVIEDEDMTVELPKYTINQVSERKS